MTRRIVLFIVALLLATLGMLAVLVYVRDADSRAVAANSPVTVVVAKSEIAEGTTVEEALSKGDLATQEFAASAVPSEAARTTSEFSGQALTTIYKGQIVAPTLFGSPPAAPLKFPIPAGKMALAIQVSDAQHVGQFLEPGAHVAVFDTFTSSTGDKGPWTPSGDGLSQNFDNNQATRLLLDRVDVLAVGATTTVVAQNSSSPDTSSPGTGSKDKTASDAAKSAAATPVATTSVLLTLAVDQAQAQKLIHASQTGSLYFTLLSDSYTPKPAPGVDNRNLFDGK
ncbi:MAG: Flp pilus assembly protein CpaB [Actinomycetota bacterium]